MDIYKKIKENFSALASVIVFFNDISTHVSGHNKAVNEMLPHIERRAKAAKNAEELMNVLNEIKRFREPLKYTNTFQLFIFTLSFALIINLSFQPNIFFITTGLSDVLSVTAQNITKTFGTPFFVILSILSFLSLFYRKHSVEYISDIIFEKDIQMDNSIKPVRIKGKHKLNNLKKDFKEFYRGYSPSRIEQFYRGEYSTSRIHHEIELFTFSYSPENATKEQEFSKVRYGMIIRDSLLNDVQITSIKTESPEGYRKINFENKKFNSKYSVHALNVKEMDELFTTSKITNRILELENAYFTNLNFEFNSNNDLCISFECPVNPFTQTPIRQHGIDNINEFIKEIEGHRKLKYFDRINEFYGNLGMMFERFYDEKKSLNG